MGVLGLSCVCIYVIEIVKRCLNFFCGYWIELVIVIGVNSSLCVVWVEDVNVGIECFLVGCCGVELSFKGDDSGSWFFICFCEVKKFCRREFVEIVLI